MDNWNIDKIQELTETEAKEMALETLEIKGHTIYLVDFEGYFGYSALVFLNGAHIYHADDFELHHPRDTREELRQWYIDEMNRKLYTEEELSEVKDYNDYDKKSHYLRNYYGMQKPNVSIFGIFNTQKAIDEHNKATEGKHLNPICFAYYDDVEFVKHCVELANRLEAAKDKSKDSYEYWKQAFYYEMCNHEYGINWDGDWDVLSVFWNVKYISGDYDLQGYFDQLDLTDIQCRAYMDARKQYFKNHENM